jgi:hypothetical protein
VIDPLYRYTSVPINEQKSAVDPVTGLLTVDIPAASTVTLISDIPSIFARAISVFIDPNVGGLTNLTIRKYAQSRAIVIDTVIAAGPIGAAGTSAQYTAAMGESFDVRVTNPTAGIITVRCWACARSV